MLVSALVCGVYLIHGLKWAVGRARPGLVIEQLMPFTHWYEFGPHFSPKAFIGGPFPAATRP